MPPVTSPTPTQPPTPSPTPISSCDNSGILINPLEGDPYCYCIGLYGGPTCSTPLCQNNGTIKSCLSNSLNVFRMVAEPGDRRSLPMPRWLQRNSLPERLLLRQRRKRVQRRESIVHLGNSHSIPTQRRHRTSPQQHGRSDELHEFRADLHRRLYSGAVQQR